MTSVDTALLFCGYAAAFAVATGVVVLDCHLVLQKNAGRSPVNVLKSPPVWIFAAACGALSAICFRFSDTPLLKGVVRLDHVAFPPLRGIIVGLAVLTIIRSKLFNIKDNAFGGEFFYTLARQAVIQSSWDGWGKRKEKYLAEDVLERACKREDFQDALRTALTEKIRAQSDEVKKVVNDQWSEAIKSKPAAPQDCSKPGWRSYHRTLINVALDCAGPGVLSSFNFFPK